MQAALFWCLLLDTEIISALTSKCCYSVGDTRNAMLQDLRVLAALGPTRSPYRKHSPLKRLRAIKVLPRQKNLVILR